MSAFVSKSQQNKKEQLLHAVAVKVGAAASLGFLGEGSSFFGPAESWKMASWGSVVREGRGCRRLIETEAEVTGAICLACVDWKKRGSKLFEQMPAQKSRAVQSKVEFF